MTTEHDFQKALGHLNKYENPQDVPSDNLIPVTEVETIRFALRLADKLLGQEVSHPMLDAAIKSYNQSGQFALQSHFTAMIEQAVKEIENGA